VCRFHRKWVEVIVDEIITAHYGYLVDYKAHQFELVRQFFELETSLDEGAAFWESERTLDIIWQYLEKWVQDGLKDENLNAWVERFRDDKWEAAKAYWNEIRSGIASAIEAGPEVIPDQVAPYQAARLDVMEKPKQKP
jgi:glyceraldehyde-3-phosphate dehydrogenase (ferredoxin)